MQVTLLSLCKNVQQRTLLSFNSNKEKSIQYNSLILTNQAFVITILSTALQETYKKYLYNKSTQINNLKR